MGGGERAGPSGVWKHQDKVKEKRVIRLSEVNLTAVLVFLTSTDFD